MTDPLQSLAGWGRSIRVPGRVRVGEDLATKSDGASLSRGLGRSYGDASLPARRGGTVCGTHFADRIIRFDGETGVLRAEAGLSLLAMNATFLPRGWFTPVSPGTQFVSLGGMVASDIHGKSHHVDGTFGGHVRELVIRIPSGEVKRCSPGEESELFWATVGGMGLTGHILEVEMQMKRVPSPWIHEDTERVPAIREMLHRLRECSGEWPMTAAWVDLLASGGEFGRGLLFKGRWAEPGAAPSEPPPEVRRKALPRDMPHFVLNRAAVRWGLNARTHHWTRTGTHTVTPEKHWYPLDKLLEWNRMYGRLGFIQHQCVLPGGPDSGQVEGLMEVIRRENIPVFLCVLKDFGAEGHGTISFPRPGFTLALDIPNRPPFTQRWVDAMNEHVIACGGRIYLTKDSHTRAEHLARMDPRLEAFRDFRDRWDPERKMKSALSVRLLGDRP